MAGGIHGHPDVEFRDVNIETEVLEESAFGGPGMPMLASKKQTMTTSPNQPPVVSGPAKDGEGAAVPDAVEPTDKTEQPAPPSDG